MRAKFRQTGFSLIEVLVALCLTTIILLKITTVQLQSLKINNQAFFINQAVEQLQSMAQIIQTTNGNFMPFLSNWNQDNKALLPQAFGEIKKYGDKYKIYLFWRATKALFWRCDIAQKNNQSCVELIT